MGSYLNFSFAHPFVLIFGSILVAVAFAWHLLVRRRVIYQYPLTSLLYATSEGRQAVASAHRMRVCAYLLRGSFFLLLLVAAAGPRLADERSRSTVQGRAIMLALDMSGSMQCFDDLQTKRSRFAVAQHEAMTFIKKRTNDLLGLVFFGSVALTRCPLTADRDLVAGAVEAAQLGLVDPQGTVLSVALALAINRLKSVTAKSKVVVLLTDGEPSQEDIDPQVVLELAKSAGVTLYTIGIGSQSGGYFEHPIGGVMQVHTPLNEKLLSKLALETGGRYFRAQNQAELASIYAEIDALEATDHAAPTYSRYYELYLWFVCAALLLLGVELAFRTRWVVL